MGQNMIIGGIVTLILVILGVWYFSSPEIRPWPLMQSKTAGGEGMPVAIPAPTKTGKSTSPVPKSTNTFRSIFTQSGSHQCDYTGADSSSQRNDVIYIADGKMRGEFRTMSAGQTTANLMIYDGGYLYAWQEGKAVGTKTAINSVADLPKVIPQDITSGAVLGTDMNNVSWNCHAWSKDPNLLKVPTYVKFSAAS